MRRFFACSAALALVLGPHLNAVAAEGQPALAPLPKECQTPDGQPVYTTTPLPFVAAALKNRKKIKILAIGGTSASLRGPVSGGHYAVVEKFLESTFKGVDVDVVHRGVSGELASDAGQRIKTEVALTQADLVLWQVGTADAMARVPLEEFRATVSRTVTWLRDHQVDVILVGLRYARSMAGDEHYQAMRRVVEDVGKKLGVLRIGRYAAEETLDGLRKSQGVNLPEVQVTDAGYACLAETLARAIASGLFLKETPPGQAVQQVAPAKP